MICLSLVVSSLLDQNGKPPRDPMPAGAKPDRPRIFSIEKSAKKIRNKEGRIFPEGEGRGDLARRRQRIKRRQQQRGRGPLAPRKIPAAVGRLPFFGRHPIGRVSAAYHTDWTYVPKWSRKEAARATAPEIGHHMAPKPPRAKMAAPPPQMDNCCPQRTRAKTKRQCGFLFSARKRLTSKETNR